MIVSVHLFVCFYVLYAVLGCPFRQRKLSTSSPPAKTATLRGRHKQGSADITSHCAKTNYQSIVPSRAGICSAFRNTQLAMDSLLSGVVAPSDLFGSAVRLVFHDAAEVDLRIDTDRMGPDGCLSSDMGSAGLSEESSITNTYIETIWQSVCDRISRADFWAMFGTMAAERAANNAIQITYQFGRTDNVDCEAGVGRLPDNQGDFADIQRVFVAQMGLTLDDTGDTFKWKVFSYCSLLCIRFCFHSIFFLQ